MSEKFTVGELVRSRNQATLDSLIPLREALEKYHKEGGYLSDVSYEDVIGKYPFLDGEPVYGLATPYPDLYYYNGRDLFPLIMFFAPKESEKELKIYGNGIELTADYYNALKEKNRGLFDKRPLKVLTKLMDDSLVVSFFCKNIDRIPKRKLFSVFTRFYPMIDYGFSQITPDIWDKILSSRTKKDAEIFEAETLHPPYSLPAVFPVYRGMEDKSNPEGYSYTLDFSTAVFFASRFTGSGKITCGVVNREDVLWRYDGRREYEIWVRPENVKKTSEIDIYSSKEVFSDLPEEEYQYFRSLLTSFDYAGATEAGKIRNLRILFLGLIMLSRKFPEIAKNNIALNSLAVALAYFDCGASCIYNNLSLGEKSFLQFSSEIYDILLIETNPRWVKFLMESFCLPDEEKRKEKEELLSSDDKQMLRNMLGILVDAIYLETEVASGKMKFELDKFRLNSSAKYISVAKDACRFLKL